MIVCNQVQVKRSRAPADDDKRWQSTVLRVNGSRVGIALLSMNLLPWETPVTRNARSTADPAMAKCRGSVTPVVFVWS
jgi:hypothetical protein